MPYLRLLPFCDELQLYLLQMRLQYVAPADIEYKNYIELSSDERQAITKKYAGEHYE